MCVAASEVVKGEVKADQKQVGFSAEKSFVQPCGNKSSFVSWYRLATLTHETQPGAVLCSDIEVQHVVGMPTWLLKVGHCCAYLGISLASMHCKLMLPSLNASPVT